MVEETMSHSPLER